MDIGRCGCSLTNWVELDVVESISPETVRQTLKKTA